jgi:hypothetical protein
MTGGMRNLHNEEHHNLYSSLNIRMVKLEDGMGGECSAHGNENERVQHFWLKA